LGALTVEGFDDALAVDTGYNSTMAESLVREALAERFFVDVIVNERVSIGTKVGVDRREEVI